MKKKLKTTLYKKSEELINKYAPIIEAELNLTGKLPEFILMHDTDVLGYGRFLDDTVISDRVLTIEIYYQLIYMDFKRAGFEREFISTLAHELKHVHQYYYMKGELTPSKNYFNSPVENDANEYSEDFINRILKR